MINLINISDTLLLLMDLHSRTCLLNNLFSIAFPSVGEVKLLNKFIEKNHNRETCYSIYLLIIKPYDARWSILSTNTTRIMEPTLPELYPHLTEEELKEVEETFDRYLLLILKIVDRLEAEENKE